MIARFEIDRELQILCAKLTSDSFQRMVEQGIGLAQMYKTRDRARYDGIGRYLHEDIGT